MGDSEKGVRRTFSEIRNIILVALAGRQQTTNQISLKSGVNWKTVESHLTHLIGKGLVREVLKSEYVRIFKLTEQGEEYVRQLASKDVKIISSENRIIVNGEVIV